MSLNRRRVRVVHPAKLFEQLEARSYLAGVGQGLVGEYFADKTLTSLGLARTDSAVNFNWAASPGASLPADGYSVRWTGQVLAEYSQTYTFYAASAGGVRVWVNGVKIIDNWATHALVENQGTAALTAGQYYPIAVEYREEGTGSIKLSWSSASRAKQVIPQSQLYRVGTSVVSGGWLEGKIGVGSGSVSGSTGSGIDINWNPSTSPPPASGSLNFNFQPAAAPAVSGYLVDAGLTYAARNGQTYGWTTSHTDTVVDRNINSNQLVDTNLAVKQGARWESAVPNGTYTVTIGVGDSGASSNNNVWIEGNNLYNYVPLGSNSFLTRSVSVNVADGKLTLGIGGASTGQTKLNFVEVAGGTVSPPPTSPPPISPPPTSPPPTSPPPTSPPPTSPPSGINFNFQPGDAPAVSGYLVDAGLTYAARDGQTYGWTTSHTDTVVDRNINSDQLVDTNVAVKQGARWELAVPNGTYTVTIGVGDSGASSNNNVWIEGNNLYNYVLLGSNSFLTRSISVNVADGRLTLGIGGASTGQTKLNFVEVAGGTVSPPPTSPPPTSPPPTSPPPASGINVNFQPGDAPTVSGYLVDAGLTYAARDGQTYGWTTSHTDTVVDRNINSNQLVDTNLAVKQAARWELAVPNGTYTVTIGVGDSGASSNNNVWIEGNNLYNYVPLGSNSFLTRSISVNVADGRLTLGIGSASTGQTKLNFVEVAGAVGSGGGPLGGALSDSTADAPVAGAIGGSSDSFHYLYKVARGNVELTARLDSLSSGDEGGLIARGGLAGGGAFVGLTKDGSSVALEYRTSTDAPARTAGSLTSNGAVYLRLVRDGNQYAGYLSPTGVDGTWQLVGTAGVNLGTFAYFGLAASGDLATAQFASVELTPTNPLGGNLNNQADRVQELAFVDLVKTTRGFFNTAGRNDPATGKLAFATTDANGWPTEDFSFDAVDNTEWGVPIDAGVYKMSFAGPSGVMLQSSGATLTPLSYSGGVYTYDVTVPANVLKLSFRFTNTGGQVRDIRVLQPGYSLNDAPTFTTKYINLLKTTGPQVLRLMDWTKTNNNPVAHWADRNTPGEATQSKSSAFGELQPVKGIAWEYAIELANLVGRDVWVNVPAMATSSYVTNLANLLRTQLNPDLDIWLEYTNEAWNTGFTQTNWIREQAVAEVFADKAANRASQLNYDNLTVDTSKPGATNPNASTWGERWYARRTKQISDLFASAWTSAGETNPTNFRIRTVLGAQVAAMSRTDNHLQFLNRFYPQPKNYIHAVGIAPYGSISSRPRSTAEEVVTSMSASVDGWRFVNPFNQVNAWGLKLVAYEIGFDTFGPDNIAAKRAGSLDPRMAEILNRFVVKFYREGGNLANWYTIGARSYNSPYGTWSITEDLDILSSPKIQGFQQARDGLPASTAAHGVFA